MAYRILALFVLILMPASVNAATTSADTLSFELPTGKGWFAGWGGGPQETLFADSTTVHNGRFAARIERHPGSSGTFSAATTGVPLKFSGSTIELRGWL
jgi:hypothetical protein